MNNKFHIYHAHSWEKNKVNIAHFFHEFLFWGIDSILNNPSTIFVLDNKLSEWELSLTNLIIKHLHIEYEVNDLTYNHNGMYRINLKNSKNYNKIFNIVHDIINKEYHVIYDPNYKVLYLRDETPRRKMISYNNQLNYLFDEVITDMSSLSFEYQVKLFMKCGLFVTIDGAHMTNVIFMNKKSKILVLTTKEKHCWTNLFGTNICINSVDEHVLNYSNFNDNIVYNDKIQEVITNFVTNNISDNL
jgi:hypothetical protein